MTSLTVTRRKKVNGSMDYNDLDKYKPDMTLVAAMVGSLLAALRRPHLMTKLISFVTSFSVAVFVAPYVLEKFGVSSQTGIRAWSFMAGYCGDRFLEPLLTRAETQLPVWSDRWMRKWFGQVDGDVGEK